MSTRIDMSPTGIANVLSAMATLGVGLTGYLGYRAGKKVAESGEKPKFKDVALPVVSGLATIACLWGSNKVSTGQLAMAGAAVGYLVKQRDKIFQSVVPEDQEAAKEDFATPGKLPKSAEDSGKGSTLCFEGYFGRWFYCSEEAVKAGIEAFNEFYGGAGASEYNTLYREWGIEETQVGYDFGFVSGENGWHNDQIEFDIDWVGVEGVKILQIIPKEAPIERWFEF